MRLPHRVLASLSAIVISAASAQTAPAANTDKQPDWLTPKLVKAPDYPAAMLERKQASEVDAVIRITKDGKLKEVLSVRSTPKAEEAEAALRGILGQWTFRPALAADCTPQETDGVVRVWFDLDNGRPAVSVAKPKGMPWVPAPPASVLNREELQQAIAQSIPRNARDSMIGAKVIVAIEVNGDTGVPVKAQGTFVELDWDMGDSPLTAYYQEGAAKGAMASRYPPLPKYAGTTWHSCVVIDYRLPVGLQTERRFDHPLMNPSRRSDDVR
jgi:hypothetical protein